MSAVTGPLMAYTVGANGWSAVPLTLHYDPADPFAVRLAFGVNVTWTVARDLLEDGLDRPAGQGDIRIWPTKFGPGALFMHLRAPSGEVVLEVSRGGVCDFLRRVNDLVPRGSEHTRLSIDAELRDLCGGAE